MISVSNHNTHAENDADDDPSSFSRDSVAVVDDGDGDDDNSIMEAKDGDSTNADGVVVASVNDVRACC